MEIGVSKKNELHMYETSYNSVELHIVIINGRIFFNPFKTRLSGWSDLEYYVEKLQFKKCRELPVINGRYIDCDEVENILGRLLTNIQENNTCENHLESREELYRTMINYLYHNKKRG